MWINSLSGNCDKTIFSGKYVSLDTSTCLSAKEKTCWILKVEICFITLEYILMVNCHYCILRAVDCRRICVANYTNILHYVSLFLFFFTLFQRTFCSVPYIYYRITSYLKWIDKHFLGLANSNNLLIIVNFQIVL